MLIATFNYIRCYSLASRNIRKLNLNTKRFGPWPSSAVLKARGQMMKLKSEQIIKIYNDDVVTMIFMQCHLS